MVQLATRVDDSVGAEFKAITKQLGATPADAIRMFVLAFNAERGFPYKVKLREQPEPLGNEEEAISYVNSLSREVIDNAW